MGAIHQIYEGSAAAAANIMFTSDYLLTFRVELQ
jgi:hypothetical protein